DVVTVRLEARLMGEIEYVWSWNSTIDRPGHERVTFRQTSLLGDAVSPESLKRRAVQHIPALGEDGRIDRFILTAMNGRASLGTIARRLQTRFPTKFANLIAAIGRVGELSVRYGADENQENGRRITNPPRRTTQSASCSGNRGALLKGKRTDIVDSTAFGQ